MTDADVITAAKGLVRVTDNTLDSLWSSHFARLYRSYCRRRDWPWMLSLDQTLSLVTGTQTYDLPSDFDRFSSDTVYYGVTGSAGAWIYNGWPVEVRRTAAQAADGEIESFGVASTGRAPVIVSLVGKIGTAGQLQARFTPTPVDTQTLLYGYYRRPATTGTIEVDPLGETLVYSLAKEMCLYHNMKGGAGENQTAFFAEAERREFAMACRTLNSL